MDTSVKKLLISWEEWWREYRHFPLHCINLDSNVDWRIQAQFRPQKAVIDTVEIQERIRRGSGAYKRA